MVDGVLRCEEASGRRSEPRETAGETCAVAETRRAYRSRETVWSDRGNCAGTCEALRAAIDATRAELDIADLRPNRQMHDLLVAGEDHRIALHPGVDPLALCRAVWRTYGRGRVEGGSTVAMQLVRVLTGRFENSWRRKAREAALAVVATRYAHWSELASLYLLVGYYGWRMNGFRQACGRLGIDPKRCSLRDSAMLVARLKYPQPRHCSEARRAQIVGRGEYLVTRVESGGKGR